MSEAERINDGGSAFPLDNGYYDQDGVWIERQTQGMTLRDWFAGQNLQNIADNITMEQAARTCYQIADAMIAERSKDGDTMEFD